jgi:hypothetical protein
MDNKKYLLDKNILYEIEVVKVNLSRKSFVGIGTTIIGDVIEDEMVYDMSCKLNGKFRQIAFRASDCNSILFDSKLQYYIFKIKKSLKWLKENPHLKTSPNKASQ